MQVLALCSWPLLPCVPDGLILHTLDEPDICLCQWFSVALGRCKGHGGSLGPSLRNEDWGCRWVFGGLALRSALADLPTCLPGPGTCVALGIDCPWRPRTRLFSENWRVVLVARGRPCLKRRRVQKRESREGSPYRWKMGATYLVGGRILSLLQRGPCPNAQNQWLWHPAWQTRLCNVLKDHEMGS